MPTLPTITPTVNDTVKRHALQQVSMFNQLKQIYLRQYAEVWESPIDYFAAQGTNGVNVFATASATVTYLLSFDSSAIPTDKQLPPTTWNITPNDNGTVTITAKGA